jgi:hypothetical protein
MNSQSIIRSGAEFWHDVWGGVAGQFRGAGKEK